MNIKFWNKKNKDVTTKEQLDKGKFGYRITICDPLGESPREIETFGARKTRDEDGVVWLTNGDKKTPFKEIFPLDNDMLIKYTKEELTREIKKLETQKRRPNENKLNKESKLLELNKLKKSLENPKGSFLKIDKDGTPHLTYVRYRTSFIPLKWDLNFATIHTPTEPLIKNVLSVQMEKMKKYHQTKENIITGGMIIFMLILVLWSGILCYFTLKQYDNVDTSRVADLQNRIDNAGLICAELYGEAGQNFYQSSVYNLNVSKGLFDRLNGNVNVIPQVTGIN